MAGFMTSAAGAGAINFFTKGIGGKVMAYVILLWLFMALFSYLGEFIPALNLTNLFSGFPSSVLWALNIIMFPDLIVKAISALATAFLIKRLPVIG